MSDQNTQEEPKQQISETSPESDQPAVADTTEQPKVDVQSGDTNVVSRAWAWCKRHKLVGIGSAILVLIVLLGAVPQTRYALAGTVVKSEISVTARDKQTGTKVSNAAVRIAGKTVTTDSQGLATVTVPVGNKTIMVSKKYYTDASLKTLVPIGKKTSVTVELAATGRQVPVAVVNTIGGKPLAGVEIKVLDTSAKTDEMGRATIVLPTGSNTYEATISANGFNDRRTKVTVTAVEDATNKFTLTPSGKVYFLSKKSGKVDVVKTNLDGTDRATVIAGTGKESDTATVLLASKDWKYLVLQSRRDGEDKLFLINTQDDKMTVIDEGKADFTVVGWQGHYFVYQVNRTNVEYWVPNKFTLKSVNAENGKLQNLVNSSANGQQYDSVYQTVGSVFLFGGKVYYALVWNGVNSGLEGKQSGVYSVNTDGTGSKLIKGFDAVTTYLSEIRAGEVGELYVLTYVQGVLKNYAVSKDGSIEAENQLLSDNGYPTYLESPNGSKLLWSDSRDGKTVVLVGDQDAKNERSIAALADYSVYGWYTDDYLLVSKKGSELFVLPVGGIDSEKELIKISDYHKPAIIFRGYGGGYGGL